MQPLYVALYQLMAYACGCTAQLIPNMVTSAAGALACDELCFPGGGHVNGSHNSRAAVHLQPARAWLAMVPWSPVQRHDGFHGLCGSVSLAQS